MITIKNMYFYLLFLLSIFFIINPTTSLANKTEQQSFSVEPILPDSQQNQKIGYYDLLVKPGMKESVSVKIKNFKDEPIFIHISVLDAYTNRYGKIDYGQNKNNTRYKLSDIVKINNQSDIRLENFEEKIITFDITPPEQPFEGVLLGALSLVDAPDGTAADSFGYRIGLILNEDNLEHTQSSILELNGTEIGWDNGFPVFIIELNNPTQYVIENLEVKIQLTKKNQEKILENHLVSNAVMAPQSLFKIFIPWRFEEIGVGSYDVTIDASIDKNKWNWQETIDVTPANLEAITKTSDSNKPINKFPILNYFIGLILLSNLSLLIFIVIRHLQFPQ